MTGGKGAAARAGGCKCGKRMLEQLNEGTCVWCGYGRAHTVREHAYARNMEENDFRLAPAATPPGPAQVLSLVRWSEDACVAAYRRWAAVNGRTPAPSDWETVAREGQPAHPSIGTIRTRFGDWHGFLRYIARIPREQAA